MRQRICPYLLSILLFWQVSASAAEPSYDFRVVIDVSGSMKKTDPQNLRVPALKLINGLIPDGSRAGVWTFGKYVDMAVKWGRVNDSWRKQADLGADKIHSNALLTNIESALKRASVGWDKPDGNSKRILLLLTDGKVDISKDSEKNAASRNRVLGSSLGALKKAAVEVHSVALSDGTDEVLLKQLALETGGSFTIASSAAELQKVFFKMFERASQPDTVEFDGREFSIDASIREMTLLLFRKPGSDPTILIPPDSPAISAQKPRGSRWRNDQGYDLITVKKPEAGVWRIDAEMDPDNRLMVVTDLKLEVDGIPTYATPAEALTITAELFNREKKIRKNSFLRFVDFELRHTDAEGNEKAYTMEHTAERKDKGSYLHSLAQNLNEGLHSFILSADSRTFNRSKRFDLQVQWPVEVVIEPQAQAGVYELRLRAREEYLKPDGMDASIDLEAPDGSRQTLELELQGGWLRTRVETDLDGLYRAHVRVTAQNHATEIYDIDMGSFSMLGVYRAPPVESANSEDETAPADTPAAQAEQPEAGINWRLVGFVVVGVNVALMLLILVGWLLYRRKKPAEEELLLEDEEVGA